MTCGKSDIKAFCFCDIIFVLSTAKAAYRIKDISLVRSTNIAEAHFLTKCASLQCLLLLFISAEIVIAVIGIKNIKGFECLIIKNKNSVFCAVNIFSQVNRKNVAAVGF